MRIFRLSLVVLVCASLHAQLVLPKILSSHMVVQRDLPVHVWGTATPGETVTVSFRGQSGSTKAGAIGRWSVYLPPGAAGGPFQLTVSGTPTDAGSSLQTIVLDDVLVGDVWVASGQSNMEFPLKNATTASEDLPKATNDHIRLLIVGHKATDSPQDDMDTDGWTASSLDSAKDFSAVAWYFAREIGSREHVPVGVIDSTWGGTPVEAWTRMTVLGEDASLAPLFVSWGKMLDQQSDAELRNKITQHEDDLARAQGKPIPQRPWTPQTVSWDPGHLYNGMIAPLTPFPIRGAIWYQGESNTSQDRAPVYGRIFRAMIEDWRRQWGVGDFPFLFVQISNFKGTPPLVDWPTVRDQQLKTLELTNTAMTVTIDIGNPDNIHPTDKLDVGLRLARGARLLSYSEHVEDSGPLFRQVTPQGQALRVWFDHAKSLNSKGGPPTGFEVAGADGKFVSATAAIDGETIVVSNSSVAEPTVVRYGWANSPQCNLFNGEGLPASPFTSVR